MRHRRFARHSWSGTTPHRATATAPVLDPPGLGVILLATLGLVVTDSFTRLNALKQALVFSGNLAAAIFFVFSGRVVWDVALVMAVGALVGGSIGGHFASRVSPRALTRVAVVIGLIVGVAYLVK